jgi:AcrR family transcriptional regulator
VLDATRSSVLAVGVRRTTLTDVARRAGVSRMTLYRMVPDVTTLILEVMTREFASLLAEAEAASARKRTARGRIVTTTVEVARRLPDEPLFRRIVDVDPELLLPYLTDRVGSTQRLAAAHVRRMLADGLADGSVRRADLDVLAMSMVLTVSAFVVSARLFDSVGRDAALDELARLLDGWLRP